MISLTAPFTLLTSLFFAGVLGNSVFAQKQPTAVGESAEPLVGDERGGLAILDLEHDWRPSRQEDCVAAIRGDYVCLHGTAGVQADYITFKRWAPDSRSFVYNAAPICSDGKGYRPRERVFTLP